MRLGLSLLLPYFFKGHQLKRCIVLLQGGRSPASVGRASALGSHAGTGPSRSLGREVLRRLITLTSKGVGRQIKAWRPVLIVEQLPVHGVTLYPRLGDLVELTLAHPACHKLPPDLLSGEEPGLFPLRHL